MYKKLILVTIIALAAIVLLSACERSAVPAQTSLTTPTSVSQAISEVDAFKTQTAVGTVTALVMTMQAGPPSSSTNETPVTTEQGSAIPTSTPLPPGVNPNAATPTPGRPATYTLQAGEFPYCIARRFNINPDDLLALNGIGDGQVFQPGLVLKIPQTGSFPGERALKPHPATYTVAVNDTIYSIACKYGDVDPFYLASYNGIVAPYVLQTGKVLNIP